MILKLMELKQPLDSWQTKFMRKISKLEPYIYIQLLQVGEHEQRKPMSLGASPISKHMAP